MSNMSFSKEMKELSARVARLADAVEAAQIPKLIEEIRKGRIEFGNAIEWMKKNGLSLRMLNVPALVRKIEKEQKGK